MGRASPSKRRRSAQRVFEIGCAKPNTGRWLPVPLARSRCNATIRAVEKTDGSLLLVRCERAVEFSEQPLGRPSHVCKAERAEELPHHSRPSVTPFLIVEVYDNC